MRFTIEAHTELSIDQQHEVALIADANNKHGYSNADCDDAIEFALCQYALKVLGEGWNLERIE